jgi:hypothetical protein
VAGATNTVWRWHTIYLRMSRWAKNCVLDRVFERLQLEQKANVAPAERVIGDVEFLDEFAIDDDAKVLAPQFNLGGVPEVEGGRQQLDGWSDTQYSAG